MSPRPLQALANGRAGCRPVACPQRGQATGRHPVARRSPNLASRVSIRP
jgi:hypothetical protein